MNRGEWVDPQSYQAAQYSHVSVLLKRTGTMFACADYLIHIEGDPLPRDVDAQQALALLSSDAGCRAPVTGAVYGTLLNDRAALLALGDTMNAAPYKAPPKAPILYLKPRNT